MMAVQLLAFCFQQQQHFPATENFPNKQPKKTKEIDEQIFMFHNPEQHIL